MDFPALEIFQTTTSPTNVVHVDSLRLRFHSFRSMMGIPGRRSLEINDVFTPIFMGSSHKLFWKTKITYIHNTHLSKGIHEDFLGGNINVKQKKYNYIYIYL